MQEGKNGSLKNGQNHFTQSHKGTENNEKRGDRGFLRMVKFRLTQSTEKM